MNLTNDKYNIDGVLISSTIIPDDVIQAETKSASLIYLSETDWYVSRRSETGVIIPPEVLLKRQLAREAI
jgi:hypothetical protein